MPDHVNGTVVVLTHNRRPELLRTLRALTAPNERPPVVVVDNGSSDGTPDAVGAPTTVRLGPAEMQYRPDSAQITTLGPA